MDGYLRRSGGTSALRSLSLLLMVAIWSACATSDAHDGSIAFIGATVVTMDEQGLVLRDQTVIVEGERISAIGPRDAVRVPRGARLIDATGRYLMPGLADMHVHLEHIEDPGILDLFVASGVTTVRNMDGRPYILEWKRRIEARELRGPRIISAGPLLDGDPPILPDNLVVPSKEEAASVVAAQKDAGYDLVKVYTNLSPDVYRSVVTSAAAHGLPVAGHVPRGIDLDEALAGLSSIEHVTTLGRWLESEDSPSYGRWNWTKLHLAMPLSLARVEEVSQRIAEASVAVVPTLVQADRGIASEETVSRWLESEELSVISEEGREFWRESVLRPVARMDTGDWKAVSLGAENRRAVVRELYESGVTILAGTDTPNPFVVPGASLHEELANLVSAGLPPVAALAAATRQAAAFLGEQDEWGTVEVGARADLLLLESDPLQAIDNTRHIVGVLLGGEWIPRAALDEVRSRASFP